MKKDKSILIALVVGSLVSPPLISADNTNAFQQFKNQQTQGANNLKQEFAQYKKELEQGFAAYKKAYQDAYNEEKKAVTKVWGDYRPGDRKKWVQYDKGGIRESVNFASGEVELEMIVNKNTSTQKTEDDLKQKILSLLQTSTADAFKKDRVAQTVENKIKSEPHVKTGKVPDTPVMGSLLPVVKSGDEKKIRQVSEQFASKARTDVRAAQIPDKKIVRVRFKVPTNAPDKSRQFMSFANKTADREKLPLPLVMAVMETESSFNPMAKSGIPAYGLMQIVPNSAGQDATAYLYGKAQILSPSYLYNGDNNIKIGTAYIHVLYYNYLKNVKDPVSRLYCAIAAYNTGAGNVARAFIGSTNITKASTKINQLSPKEVYLRLRKHLPYEETQRYVRKVSINMSKYEQI